MQLLYAAESGNGIELYPFLPFLPFSSCLLPPFSLSVPISSLPFLSLSYPGSCLPNLVGVWEDCKLPAGSGRTQLTDGFCCIPSWKSRSAWCCIYTHCDPCWSCDVPACCSSQKKWWYVFELTKECRCGIPTSSYSYTSYLWSWSVARVFSTNLKQPYDNARWINSAGKPFTILGKANLLFSDCKQCIGARGFTVNPFITIVWTLLGDWWHSLTLLAAITSALTFIQSFKGAGC